MKCLFLVLLGALALSGCAVLPIPLSPENEQYNSNTAEGTWLVLDAIDTMQTVQIAKHPECYHEADGIAAMLYGGQHPNVGRVIGTNLVLAIGHTMVTSWLDDEVASHEMTDTAHPELPGTVGPWYVGRIVWHAVSILGTGIAVGGNYNNGLMLNHVDCTPISTYHGPMTPPTTVLLHP